MATVIDRGDAHAVASKVYDYLGITVDASASEVDQDGLRDIVEAELANQAKVVRYPDAGLTADLLEALCRRVARNRAVRNLPLGFQTSMSEAAVAVARIGTDSEVRRLEAPYRKVVVG